MSPHPESESTTSRGLRSPAKLSQRRYDLLLIAVIAVAAGCGSMDVDLQRDVANEARPLSPAVEDDQAVRDLGEATALQGLPEPEDFDIPDHATMETYVGIALDRNPGIHRAIRRLQALGYRVPQVTSLKDPIAHLLPPTGDLTETAAGMISGAVGIAQTIPFPGKLDTRGRVAEQEVRMAFDELDEVRIGTVVDVLQAYDRYYLADVSIQINRESEALLTRIRDVAAARYRSGAATQQDVLRAEVELYGLTNELITLQQERASAAAQINSLMNRRVDAPLPPPRAFDLDEIGWMLPQAMQSAVENNPRLARLQEQIKRDLELIALADLDYYPDLTVGFSYTFVSGSGLSPVANGDDVVGFPFLFNLPIWRKRLRAQVLERNSQTLSSVEAYEDLRNRIFFQLQDTLVKIDTQYRQAVLLRDLIVPRSWQAVDVSTAAYRSGELEFTALIENWRQWLGHSLGYHRALVGLELRFADLQYLIGVRIPRSSPEEPTP